MSAHTDPVFYERFEFCRSTCDECDRLDAEQKVTMSREEIAYEGARRALAALTVDPNTLPPIPEQS